MEFNTNFGENLPSHSSFSTKKPNKTLFGNEISTISNGSYQNVSPFDKSVAGGFLSNPSLGYKSHFYDPFISSETLSANESFMHSGPTIGSNSLQTTEIPNYNQRILFQDLNSQQFNSEGYLGLEYQNPLNDNSGLNNEGLNQNIVKREDKPRLERKKERAVHSSSKGQWTPMEDSQLTKLVEEYGYRSWSHIAGILKGRVGKQCRERWLNHLRPDIKKEKITKEEEHLIVVGHQKYGSRWARIAKDFLPGRSENAIKNHFNAAKRRMFPKNGGAHPNTYFEEYIKSVSSGSSSTGADAIDTGFNLDDNEQMLPSYYADVVSSSFVDEENNCGVESMNAYFPCTQWPGPVAEPIGATANASLEYKDHMLPNNVAYVAEEPYYPVISEWNDVAPIPGETPDNFSLGNNSNAPNLGGMGPNIEDNDEFLRFATGWK